MVSVLRRVGALALLALISACGGSGTTPDASTHTVSVTVTGLRHSYNGATLRNNGGDDLKVFGDGSYTFKTALAAGTAFAVAVSAQPTGPDQTCTVSNGSGTIAASDVTNVAIDCPYANAYAVGGTVNGLTGTGLTLQYNADNVSLPSIDQVNANGAFVFDASRTSAVTGTVYGVSVVNQPTNPAQTCVVINGGGTVAAADVIEQLFDQTRVAGGLFPPKKEGALDDDSDGDEGDEQNRPHHDAAAFKQLQRRAAQEEGK